MPDYQFLTVIVVGVVWAIALIGFFKTKKAGFGPYNTSALVMILVLFIAVLAFFSGKVGGDDILKLLFAAVGFAAGMFTRDTRAKSDD